MKKKELEINTVIVDGDATSFRAALSRSLMGVSWVKFKRKKQAFYQNRAHNLAITQSVFSCLYENLLANLKNPNKFKLKTNMKPEWNENGKIEAISNVSVSVYMKIGELQLGKLEVQEEFENAKIDLFYSQVDLASKELMSKLPEIIKSMGKEDFDYHQYDFGSAQGREMGKAYGVEGTPTVVINAEKKLPNPSENQLRQEIKRALAPMVRSIDKVRFIYEPGIEPIVESLAETLKVRA